MSSAVLSLIIFGICIVLFAWDRLPMATVALLGCALMVVTGVCDFSTVFGQLASKTVIMLVGVLIMGAALTETGVAARIGGLLGRLTENGERVFIAATFLLAMLLSAFLTNVTVLAIFIPIVLAISRENGRIDALNVVIPLTLAVNMGGITTLVGSSQQMTAQGILEEYGYGGFKVFDFTPFGLILGAGALLYVLFIGYPLGKKIWGERQANEIGTGKAKTVEYSLRKTVSIAVIFTLTVFFYVAQKVPFTDIDIPPHVTSTLGALACIITGCISQGKAITSVNWNIVGRLGGCLGLAKALSCAGGIGLVSDAFMRLGGADLSPIVFFAVITLFTQLISLFISNSTAISVSLLTVIAVAPALSLNVQAFAMGIVLAASMGASCPLSGSTWGISMTVGYRFRDYVKYGVGADILSLIIILVTVPLLMSLTV